MWSLTDTDISLLIKEITYSKRQFRVLRPVFGNLNDHVFGWKLFIMLLFCFLKLIMDLQNVLCDLQLYFPGRAAVFGITHNDMSVATFRFTQH